MGRHPCAVRFLHSATAHSSRNRWFRRANDLGPQKVCRGHTVQCLDMRPIGRHNLVITLTTKEDQRCNDAKFDSARTALRSTYMAVPLFKLPLSIQFQGYGTTLRRRRVVIRLITYPDGKRYKQNPVTVWGRRLTSRV